VKIASRTSVKPEHLEHGPVNGRPQFACLDAEHREAGDAVTVAAGQHFSIDVWPAVLVSAAPPHKMSIALNCMSNVEDQYERGTD